MTLKRAILLLIGALVVVMLLAMSLVWRFAMDSGSDSFKRAEAILREAGLPASAEELAKAIEPVPPEQNAAAPFLEAARLLAGEEDAVIAAYQDLYEYPSLAAYAAADELDRQSLESLLTIEAERQAEQTARSLQEVTQAHPQLKQDIEALAAMGGGAADPNKLPDSIKWAIIRAGVTAQAEALAATEGGADLRWPLQADFGVPWSDPPVLLYELDLDYVTGQREVSRLLGGAARQAAAEGRARDAVDLLHRMWSQAEAQAAGGRMYVELMVQAGLEANSLATAADVLPALPAEALAGGEVRSAVEALAQRLANESERTEALRRGIAGESVAQIQVCRAIADASDAARSTLGLAPEAQLRPAEDAVVLAQVMTGALAALQMPDETSADARLPNLIAIEMRIRERQLQIAATLLPSIDLLTEVTFNCLAKRRLVSVAIAASLYRADHGELPDSLEALVPRYLAAVPRDPTAKDAHIGYDPERAIAWTVGNDRDDDEGLSREDVLRETPDASARVLRDSTDEVVHLGPHVEQ
jgi:hypothetical protein